ncbi:MAG: hypothetical protein ACI8X5_004079 [Planctomycetota bacterium]|jgi:hypothetical protein
MRGSPVLRISLKSAIGTLDSRVTLRGVPFGQAGKGGTESANAFRSLRQSQRSPGLRVLAAFISRGVGAPFGTLAGLGRSSGASSIRC